ncbi:hypothetical protein [Amycolatopsis sp. CA-230715]|uniref:hypothetical protein n=1 Tax=Amycolatopsis sp. CA-230715 TaxID=2745196 RepID=UPI001C02FE87|nr:hypothetical protein [Amycolatopsis sp. CA-230715]QWF82908.1 hypothetical protein HUW46_06347 [Amycolatopsis sp. CA-230715]
MSPKLRGPLDVSDSAATLRSAARVLRETAAKATPGVWAAEPVREQAWTVVQVDGCLGPIQLRRGDAEWMALMSPSMTEPLAAWLDQVAAQVEVARRERRTVREDWLLADRAALDFATRILSASGVPDEPDAEVAES